MQKTIRLSRPLQWLCRALIVLLPLGLIFFWIVVTPIHKEPIPLDKQSGPLLFQPNKAPAAVSDYIPGTGYIPGLIRWATDIDIVIQHMVTIGDFNLELRFAPSGPVEKLLLWQRMSAGLLSALSLSFTLLILFYLSQLFSWYSKGDIFSERHVRCFKRIALTLIAAQLCRPILDGGMRLILTWFNSAGRIMTISFDNANILALFSGIVILLIALIMEEGYKINQEIQLTV
jgi:hypothetical protein